MTTRYMRQRMAKDERDPDSHLWLAGCFAGLCYLVLISYLG